MLSIEAACYWLAQRPPSAIEPLSGNRDADVVIVGAGLTGLWTALALKELDPAVEVVVVEQGVAAYGASGRNAGMLSETIDHSHGLAIEHFGEAAARRLARLGQENVDAMYRFLVDRGIDCHLERNGRLMMALTPAQVEEARSTVAIAERLGIRSFSLLDADQVQDEVHSPLYLGGVGVSGGGILDPVRLVDGLAREARRLGVRVHERSRVKSIERNGAGVLARGEHGSVRARRAVLATSAYTHHLLPRILRRFIPLYDYILVSDPLTETQWQAIGWQRRQGVTDLRTFFNYYRPTKDGRILWGTSEATYYSGNRVGESCDHSPAHYAALRESFRRHFPAVSDLRFPYAWGGAICSTTRMTPFFGSAEGGRILYGLGYTGHGLGTTRLAGYILAAMTLERPSDVLDLPLVTKRPFPYPPEPFRSLAVAAVTRALRRVDEGEPASLLLRFLSRMGIGFSS
jgi:glycine/D-amino acid oxidase-like deaminating enzyme